VTAVAVTRRTLRDLRRAPLVWGGALGAFAALEMAIYPSVKDSLTKAVENYPQGLKDAFGITDFGSAAAYLDAEMFSLIVPLALAVFGVRAMVRATVGAEERGWLDVTLTAPLTRSRLVAGAYAGMAGAAAGILAVMAVLAWLAAGIAGAGLAFSDSVAGAAAVWPLVLFFAGLAMLLAGLTRGSAVVTGIAAGTLVGMYILNVTGRAAPSLHDLRYLSAFKYYGSAVRDGIDPLAFAGVSLAGIVLAVAGALLFERRDVRA
jgi:ABC-2 type transport system permease protein